MFVAFSKEDFGDDQSSDVEFVTFPTLLDVDGRFVSHVEGKSKHKSSLDEKHMQEEHLHVEIPVFQGKTLRLRLSKNRKFTAPGLVIEEGEEVQSYDPKCHFEGHIVDQPNSSASISYCKGLVSFNASYASFLDSIVSQSQSPCFF